MAVLEEKKEQNIQKGKLNDRFCDMYKLYNYIQQCSDQMYDDMLMVDIRKESEFAKSHIIDSINFPFDKFYLLMSNDESFGQFDKIHSNLMCFLIH